MVGKIEVIGRQNNLAGAVYMISGAINARVSGPIQKFIPRKKESNSKSSQAETGKDVFAPHESRVKTVRMIEEQGMLHEGAEVVHVGSEILEAIEAGGVLAALGTLGSVASGVYFGIEGARDLKTAIKEKNLVEGIEASGHLSVAGEAAIGLATELTAVSSVSAALGPAVTAAINSPLVELLGTGMGVVHGAAEVIVGGKEIYDGIRDKNKIKMIKGALTTGLGVSVAAIALGGGVPMGIALAAIFTGKMVMKTKFGDHMKKKAIQTLNMIPGMNLDKYLDLNIK